MKLPGFFIKNQIFPKLIQILPKTTFRLSVVFLFCLVGINSLPVRATVTAGNWVFPDRDYRMPITVQANGYARTNKIAELDIDFGAKLTAMGIPGSFDEDSVRVVEVDASGSSLDDDVPFQFDNGSTVDEPAGTLVFMMVGNTAVSTTRYYHIYFDTTGTFTQPSSLSDRVQVQPEVTYQDQQSFVITSHDSDSTTNATYYYHKLGAGFASIIDRQGNDWITYQSGSGTKSGGEYRGIPNLGPVFHPGYSQNSGDNQGSNSKITDDGPLKVTIYSVSKDGKWKAEWGIYPTHIQMTLIDHPNSQDYWMLFEGTPGGQLNYSSAPRDYMVKSDGSQIDVNQAHTGDLSPEWVYFADGTIDRSIFVAHGPNDSIVDSYRYLDNFDDGSDANGMTVLGFGRDKNSAYLGVDGATFAVGFIEDRDFSNNQVVINDLYQDLIITVGNEAPSLDTNVGFTVNEGDTAVFSSSNLASSDPEGGDIWYVVQTPPANGTLYRNDTALGSSDSFTQTEVNGGVVTYDHDGSETTGDSFTFKIADDGNSSAANTFLIGVTAVNDPPITTSDSAEVNAGLSVVINLLANDTDVDSTSIFVTSLTQPTLGSVVNNGDGTVTYSAPNNHEGSDSFTYRASDGEKNSAVTTVEITVVNTASKVFLPAFIKP